MEEIVLSKQIKYIIGRGSDKCKQLPCRDNNGNSIKAKKRGKARKWKGMIRECKKIKLFDAQNDALSFGACLPTKESRQDPSKDLVTDHTTQIIVLNGADSFARFSIQQCQEEIQIHQG